MHFLFWTIKYFSLFEQEKGGGDPVVTVTVHPNIQEDKMLCYLDKPSETPGYTFYSHDLNLGSNTLWSVINSRSSD